MKDLRLKKGSSEWKRFWAKVNKTDGCWKWTGGLDENGYGSFWLRGGSVLPHRVSYTSQYGPIVSNFGVHHNCDNPACVKPHHLVIGTQKDNMMDASDRGRLEVFTGSNHKLSKLKEADILEIRASKLSEAKLGKIYGVSHTAIGKIRRNESWTHVKGK